jgi:hypothetical protein
MLRRFIPLAIIVQILVLLTPATALAACSYANGGPGGGGGASQTTGSSGTAGGTAGCSGGGGGGGGGGSASGGAGTSGGGGGVLLKTTSGMVSVTGSVDARGGNSSTTNGGTVKLFSSTGCPSVSAISAGRIYSNTPTGNCPPAAPTLVYPVSTSTGNSVFTVFQLRSSDQDSDYLRYWIDVCSDNACSSIIRSICQTNTGTGVPGTCTPSQTGWAAQDQQTGTAYTGNSTLTLSTLAIHSYQPPYLSANSTYYWRGYAIDPGGSNTWSSASAIQSFVTAPTETHIQGNVRIQGNVKL